MANKIGMVSLGCPKNQIDAEIMLASLKSAGFEIVPEEAEADAIIINTCGFIEDAKTEAIENILDVARLKGEEGKLKALIVTGCLAERYRDDITNQLPEVDCVVGIGSNKDIVEIVKKALSGEKKNYYGEKSELCLSGERLLTTLPFTAYIKISEGCNNNCTYCAIPSIRGKMRSRTIEDIVEEAKKLSLGGVKELVIVAQDPTRYGEDLYGKCELPRLLNMLCEIESLHWIRILYAYPERITDELIEVIAKQDKICKYLDIPIQHANGEILRRMNRKGNKESLIALINKLRKAIPEIALRTSLITGFPGETEEQFNELCEFVSEIKFDKLGCFAYSPEEDTPAAEFEGQIDEQTKVDRAEIVMNDQLRIVLEKNGEKVGKVFEVLIEGYDDYIKCYFGRTQFDAPDIDSKVFFLTDRPLSIGSFVNVRINDLLDYDLLGELED